MIGVFAALGGALCWAIASRIYHGLGNRYGALFLNLFKNTFALLLLSMIMVSPWSVLEQSLPNLKGHLLLVFSGLVGMGIGDIAFLAAVKRLGAPIALAFETLAPVFSAAVAWFWFGEILTWREASGVLLIVGGLVLLAWRKKPLQALGSTSEQTQSRLDPLGVVLALVAALAQGSSAAMSRWALILEDISTLYSTMVRVAAGALFCVLMGAFLASERQKLAQGFRLFQAGVSRSNLLIAALIGTACALWLQQLALQNAPAAIAQALLSLSPLLILPWAVFVYGDNIPIEQWLAAGACTLGAVLLAYAQLAV